MTAALRHRGPDEEGIVVQSPLAVLGHRRLSIIDLAQGQQPMAADGGNVWITYNGEVYNFRTLRAHLEAKGHRFRTSSDTEVVLAAYLEWGEQCPEHLEGMFAFAILDLPQQRLFLARDHLGKKPLYVRWRNGVLDFASELSALQTLEDWSGEPDPVAWAFYLRLGYIPSPWTAYRGVEKLRPAECCVVDRHGPRTRRYWQPSARSVDSSAATRDVVDRLEAVLEEAVRARLVSEVPLGAFLSGGIDSGLVVSLMAKISGPGVKTTSVGFAGEPEGDELAAARRIADHNRADHQELVIRPDAASVLQELMRHFGEPFADSSALPTWYISKEVRKRVTVALTGDGGDEAFGGYSFRYLPHDRDARLRRAIPSFLRRSLFAALAESWPQRKSLPRPLRLRNLFRNLSMEEDRAYYHDLCFTSPELAAQLAPELARHEATVEEHVREVYRAANTGDALQAIMLADVSLYLPEDVLVKVDRMSMAHGLEVRSPLLAKSVVELALSLPSSLKVADGTTKLILRRLAERYLPEDIVALPKRGFHAPVDAWFRGELRSRFEAQVLGAREAVPEWIDLRAVRRLWEEHRSGRLHLGTTLWTVWALAVWSASSARPVARMAAS